MEIKKIKINALNKLFNELGYQASTKIGPNEIQLFLNKQSKTGRFDPILTEKLFQVLNFDEISSTMTIEEFIKEFLEFEDDIRKNAELFSIKLTQEKEIYDKILDQCRLYQYEKINSEGFCENAKVYGEITDINIKEKLEGINEIIILIIYNDKKEELRFRMGDKNSSEMLKKSFSFKPTSRKDNFEFIMRGVNENNQIFDIGSKVFPLNDITSHEEYLVQIIIPEIDNPNKIAAYINAKIVLYMSDFKYYESLRKKQEKRLKKFSIAANKAAEYLKCVREIYGDLSVMKSEITVNYNNEKLMQRKGAKINVNFNNVIEGEAPRSNFYVEYNNSRKIERIPLNIQTNGAKEIINPVTETQDYEYKYNYTSDINQNVINGIEKKIEILNNDKEIIMNNLQNIPKPYMQNIPISNIQNIPKPNIRNIPIPFLQNIPVPKIQNFPRVNIQKPNIEEVNIKKTTDNIIIKNQELQKVIENKENQRYLIPNQIFTNENVIKEQIKSQEIIPSIVTQPKSEKIFLASNDNSQIFQKLQTTTETETKSISNPQYTLVNPTINETKFDIDSFLKQTTTQEETQEKAQKQTNQTQTQTLTQLTNQMNQMYTQQLNQKQTRIQTQSQAQKQTQYKEYEQTQKQIQIQKQPQTQVQKQVQTQYQNTNIFPYTQQLNQKQTQIQNQAQEQKQIQYQKQEQTQKQIQIQNHPQTQIQIQNPPQTQIQTQVQLHTQNQSQITNISPYIQQLNQKQTQIQTQTKTQKQIQYQKQEQTQKQIQIQKQPQNQIQTQVQKQVQTQSQNTNIFPSQISFINGSQNKNIETSGKIQQTTETTNTIKTIPAYFSNKNQAKNNNINLNQNKNQTKSQNILINSVNGQERSQAFIKSFMAGENVDQYINTSNKETTTETKTTEQKINQYKSANIKTISNKTNINNKNVVVNTQYQKGQKIEYARPSVHEIVAKILKKKTIMKEEQTLEPIVNKVKIRSSCGNALLREFIGKPLVSEKILPVSYLPEKVNTIIYEEKIITLPVIRTNSPASYKDLNTIVHEPKVVYKGENNIENNANIADNNNINIHNSHNNFVNNFSAIRNSPIQNNNNNYVKNINGNSYNFNKSVQNNFINKIIPSKENKESNSNIIGISNYDIVNNVNDNFTTKSTEKKTINISQINPNF